MKSVTIALTGRANVASVRSAFSRLGVATVLSDDPERLAAADYAVLPGVGSFGTVAQRLRACGIQRAFKRRVAGNLSTLGICLGMQLFFSKSAESPGQGGMAVLPSSLRAFDRSLPVPQFGWNRVGAAGSFTPQAGWAYFANSYHASEAPSDWAVSWAEYGSAFIASLERGRVLLCQYHPELSGGFGLSVLERWLDAGSLV